VGGGGGGGETVALEGSRLALVAGERGVPFQNKGAETSPFHKKGKC
jgi:hypothetical protein